VPLPAPPSPAPLSPDSVDDRPEVQALFRNLKAGLPDLVVLLEEVSSHWGYEDPLYRFYHQSSKLYEVQNSTLHIVAALKALLPERQMNAWFRGIVSAGTGKDFDVSHNQRWLAETRPIVEAFFHARYFLEMAVRYGSTLDAPPNRLPSGWASILYLYDLR